MKLYRIEFVLKEKRQYWMRWADHLSAAWERSEQALDCEFYGRAKLKSVYYIRDYRGA